MSCLRRVTSIYSLDKVELREINELFSCLHNKINNLNKIKKYTDFKTRLNFMNSFVIGKLNYMLPI